MEETRAYCGTMKKALYVLFSVILVSSMLIAGCRPVQEAETPIIEGGTLNLYGIDPHTLDPAVSNEMTSHEYIVQLFSGLVRLDDNQEPIPDIASKWQVSNGGRTYTFYLKRGVKFHDGREVKADDFRYSWERTCAPETGSLTAATYLGDIEGVGEVLAGESEEISGVRVVNDYTLEVTIDEPRPYFLLKLTYTTAFVVDRFNVAAGDEWWRQPNGTGPFKFGRWDKNTLFVLEKNELYYDEVPHLDTVVYHLWAGVPMQMYEMGEIDITGVYRSYIDRVTDEAGPFYDELMVVPELSFSYIGFNCSRPPFDDVNIRRAFTRALDKDKMVSLVYGGMVQKAEGILPAGIPGFNESLTGLNFDVNEARELIRESSYGDVSNLPPITITTTGWGASVSRDLEAIITQWRQNLGVEVRVRQLEPERFLYHLKEEKDEMYYTGWVADYPHPQNFLDVLFHSGADNNYGEYSNPQADALLDIAGVEPDNELSLTLYQQVEGVLVEDAACLPLWFGEQYVLVKPYVKGYGLDAMGIPRLNKVWIESE